MYNIRVITTDDAAYNQVLALRQMVLRDPLGMNLFDEDLRQERNHVIFVCENEEGKVIGCTMIHRLIASSYKLRQMAVRPDWQNKGVGSALVKAAEQYCKERNVDFLSFYARITAMDFYASLGYVPVGEPFEHIGILHIEMVKKLSY